MKKAGIEQQPIQIKKQRVVLALAGLLAVLLLFRDLGGISVPKVVFIVIATVGCLFGDKSGIYCLMAFLTPLAQGISYTYIAAIALIVLLLKQNLKLRASGFLPMVVILLIELFSAFRGAFSFVDYFRFTGVFFIAFLRMIDTGTEYDNPGIIKMYLAGYIVAVVDIFGQMLKRYSWMSILSLGVRMGDTRQLLDIREEGMLLAFNPNELGTICTLAVLFSLLLYKKEKRPWYPLLFVLASLIGFMTQSRSFVIVYILAIMLYICFSMRTLQSALKTIVGFTVGGGVIVLLANWLIPGYISGIFDRFAVSDVSNGRITIMQYYFNEMFKHIDRFIFGVGLQNYRVKYNYFASAHNGTQEILITWGIIGLIAVILFLIASLFNAKKMNPQALPIQYIPLISFLIDIQSGQGFSNTPGMLCLMVAYSAILIPLKSESGATDGASTIHNTEQLNSLGEH